MKPILFNTEMVRAALDGRKTVTRRVVKAQHLRVLDSPYHREHPETPDEVLIERLCEPPYRPGDILYVRETWKRFCGILYGRENGTYIPLDDFEGYQYKADEQCICAKGINPFCDGFDDQKRDISFDDKWHPSIHMPKEAARLFLRVTNVRAERLQDITNEQVLKEDIRKATIERYVRQMPSDAEEYIHLAHIIPFSESWNTTIKKSDRALYGWDANPYVWVVEFERISREEAMKDEKID